MVNELSFGWLYDPPESDSRPNPYSPVLAIEPCPDSPAPCPAQVLRTPVSQDMLGRVFNGSGKPIDGGCGAPPCSIPSIQYPDPHLSDVRRMRAQFVLLESAWPLQLSMVAPS